MLALTDHLAADSSAFSVIMDSVFWPTIPYAAGGLIIFATLLSELDMIALMGGRRQYLKRRSGLLRLVLAAVGMAVFWLMTVGSGPLREVLDLEFLPVSPAGLGFILGALAFVVVRGDRLTRAGVSCRGASVGAAGLMLVGGRAGTTATPERDDTDGTTK